VRAHKLAIDSVTFDVHTQSLSQNAIPTQPSEGAYIYGLFLEGAGWDVDARQLCESHPRVLIEAAPVLWLRPCRFDGVDVRPSYDCPVYRTGERRGILATTGHNSNFLMYMKMPSDLPEHHWILRGVCMLTSHSD
jgi:dynein heavy chain